jgi:hypothetical protein
LMGHGTGAACVNLLLTSPVAQASSGNQCFCLSFCLFTSVNGLAARYNWR